MVAERGPLASPLHDEEAPVECGNCGSRRLFTEMYGRHVDFSCLACAWRKTILHPLAVARWDEDSHVAMERSRRGRPRKVPVNGG